MTESASIPMRFILAAALLLWVTPAWAQQPPARPGIDANSASGPIDPTKNVEALVKALEEKTRELRESDAKLVQAKLDSIEKIAELRSKHGAEDLIAAARRRDDVENLRASLGERLAVAERDRINAIRLVDVSAAADLQRRTSESAATLNTQTTQLATDLRTSTALLADNLRTLVNTTAASQLAAQKQDKDETSKRLTTIEQALSEGRGKQLYQDPAITSLLANVETLTQQRAATTGGGDMLGYILAGVVALIALGGLALNFMKRNAP